MHHRGQTVSDAEVTQAERHNTEAYDTSLKNVAKTVRMAASTASAEGEAKTSRTQGGSRG